MATEVTAAAGASPPEGGGGAGGRVELSAAQISEVMALGQIAKCSLSEVNSWIAAGKTPRQVSDILVARAAEASAKAPAIDSGTLPAYGLSEVPADLLVNTMRRLLAERGLKANGN